MLNLLTLPAELILSILHHLDLKAFNRLACVSHTLHNMTTDPSIWKSLLNRYFPYLRENNPDRADLKALFIEEYCRFKKKYENFDYSENFKKQTIKIPMHEVLAALDGKPNLAHRMWIQLLALAEINGKQQYTVSKRTLSNAMVIAAESGHTAAVLRILQRYGNDLSGKCLIEAHITAALHGHLPIVKVLEKQTPIPPSKIAMAIVQACKTNNSDIIVHYNEWLLNKDRAFNRIFNELNQDDFLILLGCLIKVGKNDQAKAIYDVAKKLTKKKRSEWRTPIQEMTLSVSIQYGNAILLQHFLDNPVTEDPFPFHLLPDCTHQPIIIAMREKFKEKIPREIELALCKNYPSLFLKEIETIFQSNAVVKWTSRQLVIAFLAACRQNAVQLIEKMVQRGFKHFYYDFAFKCLIQLIHFGHEKIAVHLLSSYLTNISSLHLDKIIHVAILHRRFEVIGSCIKLFKSRISSSTIEILFRLAKDPSNACLQAIIRKNGSASITIKRSVLKGIYLEANPSYTNAFNRRLKEAMLSRPNPKQTILQAWHRAKVSCGGQRLLKSDKAKSSKLLRK